MWTYTVPNADVQYLKAGETKTETFTVKAADGTTHDVVVVITGVNDAAVIGGDAAGAVTEDTATPTLSDTGTLTISDADTGEASFQTTGITSAPGTLGSLSITSAGVWTYTVPNADVQYLNPGESKTETFTVRTTDGTTRDVVVVIHGVDDDRAITVTGLPDVSEGSNTIFTVALPGGNARDTEISLGLSTGSAAADDYSALAGASAYYFDGNGDPQPLTISPAGKVTLPSGVDSFFVKVPTAQDSGLEGAENFSLNATVTGGKSASGSSTILDDGSGKVYNDDGTDSGAPGNDDRAITVTGLPDVSEGSNTIFTVALPGGNARDTEISLGLSTGSAAADDYSALAGASAYYFDGNGDPQPLTISPAGKVTLPSGVDSFFVKVPTAQDSGLEGAENFSLNATVTGGKSASGSSTILDDGSGKVYNDDGTDSGAPGNDDRPVPTPIPETPAAGVPAATVLTLETSSPREPLRFDSTTFTAAPQATMPQLSAEVLALIRPALDPALDRSSLTRPTGFQVMVSPMGIGELNLNRSITDQFVERSAASTFVLPFDTFTHARPDATVVLAARLADGRALPAWIAFDPRAGSFRTAPPAGLEGEFVIEVIARDEKGNEVKTQFKLSVGQKAVNGRIGLSEQFKLEAKRSTAWQDSVRQSDGAAQDKVAKAPVVRLAAKAGA